MPLSREVADSIRHKLARVPKHVDAIKSCVDAYSARNPTQMVSKSHNKAALDISAAPPVDIAVIAGEAIYEMRSVLDHLAFELVKTNAANIQLPLGWDEKCEFPIFTMLKPGQKTPLPYGCFKKLPGISVPAHTFIESVQSYYPIGEVNHSLRFLKELSNIDKHRHLALTKGRGHVSEHRTMADGTVIRGHSRLDHDAEIDLVGPNEWGYDTVEVDFMLSTLVTFNEPILGNANSLPVQELLEQCLRAVEGYIVPAFDKLI